MSVSGRFYDGQTSQSHDMRLDLDSSALLHPVPALFQPLALQEVKISSRIGNTPRVFSFPDGASFETEDNDTVDNWLKKHSGSSGWAHLLESKLSYALGALFFIVAFVTVGAIWGIPWLSGIVADNLPAQVSTHLGEGAMESMDKLVFQDSSLTPERRQELQRRFSELLPADTEGLNYTLLFRGGGYIGPNAFALPNGNIVITDELVALAENDDEIASVLLHEIGHVVHRHSLKQIIGHSGLAMLTVALTGDVSSAGALVVALPNILLQSSYSRNLEWEADGYSLERMQSLGIAPAHFANFMERIQNYIPPEAITVEQEPVVTEHDAAGTTNSEESDAETQQTAGACSTTVDEEWEKDNSWLNYLSTHPASEERIARFRNH